MIRFGLALFLATSPAMADTIVAARTIPAQSIIGPNDIVVHNQSIPGTIGDPVNVIGMEARVALYAGRPIRMGDVGTPAVVERNQIITLHYQNNGLAISTEGRALGRAGPGDVIRAMNMSSRSTVSVRIGSDGAGYVSQ